LKSVFARRPDDTHICPNTINKRICYFYVQKLSEEIFPIYISGELKEKFFEISNGK
jgi:hypothetical protein